MNIQSSKRLIGLATGLVIGLGLVACASSSAKRTLASEESIFVRMLPIGTKVTFDVPTVNAMNKDPNVGVKRIDSTIRDFEVDGRALGLGEFVDEILKARSELSDNLTSNLKKETFKTQSLRLDISCTFDASSYLASRDLNGTKNVKRKVEFRPGVPYEVVDANPNVAYGSDGRIRDTSPSGMNSEVVNDFAGVTYLLRAPGSPQNPSFSMYCSANNWLWHWPGMGRGRYYSLSPESIGKFLNQYGKVEFGAGASAIRVPTNIPVEVLPIRLDQPIPENGTKQQSI